MQHTRLSLDRLCRVLDGFDVRQITLDELDSIAVLTQRDALPLRPFVTGRVELALASSENIHLLDAVHEKLGGDFFHEQLDTSVQTGRETIDCSGHENIRDAHLQD